MRMISRNALSVALTGVLALGLAATTPYASADSKESSKSSAAKQQRGDSKEEEAKSQKGDKKHSKEELLADASDHDRDHDDRHHISP